MGGLTLELRRTSPGGARPQGLVVSRARLLAAQRRLEPRAARYPELRLSLTADLAILWSAEPTELPWIEEAVWLGAPEARIFSSIGWRYQAGALLRSALSRALERERGLTPPVLLLPEATNDQTAPARVIGLCESAPLAAVDWSRLVEEPAA